MITLNSLSNQSWAQHLWQNTLSRIDSVFGRLVYLSSLCNQNSGRYEHFGLTQIYGSKETDRAMREAHRKAFSEWLCFSLREQLLELEDYLGSPAVDRRLVLRAWECPATYHSLVPPDAGDAERQLFLCDFEMILAVMRTTREVAGSQSAVRNPNATSQHQPPQVRQVVGHHAQLQPHLIRA